MAYPNKKYTLHDSPICFWKYHNSHNVWRTSCNREYNARDFGCKEIKTCPNCERVTRRGY